MLKIEKDDHLVYCEVHNTKRQETIKIQDNYMRSTNGGNWLYVCRECFKEQVTKLEECNKEISKDEIKDFVKKELQCCCSMDQEHCTIHKNV